MGPRALAIDLGSSSVRAIVFEPDARGAVSPVAGALARRARHVSTDAPGQATFDGEGYLTDLVACIDELNAQGCLEGVGHIAVDSQWHSIVPVDKAGRPTADVVSWADTRAVRPSGCRPAPAAEALEALRQRTGCAFAPMYWTWRAPWLGSAFRSASASASAEGAGGAGASSYLGLPELVGLRLLGDPTMSVSIASGTGLLNVATQAWDDEALELAHLAPSRLPPLASSDWRGRLSASWRRRWPPLADAIWHPALGDGAAANLGVGCDGPARVALTVGTSAAARAVRPGPDPSRLPAGLWRYCVDHDRVVVGAAYSSGGQLYSWALSLWEAASTGATGTVGGAASHAGSVSSELRYDVDEPVGPGSEGVLVLPWHAGTRPPEPPVPGGRGCVLNLGLGHTGAHVVSAAVEAVCYQLAEGLSGLEAIAPGPVAVVASGGAIERSPWWKQRLASVLGRPVRFPQVAETTARGAAALALGVAVNSGEDPGEVVEPVGTDVRALARARDDWRRWYRAVLPIAGRARPGGQD